MAAPLVSITSGTASLVPFVAPYVRSCPTPVAAQTLCGAAWDWCLATESWRETLSTLLTVEDQAEYTLVLPIDTAANPDVPYPATIIRLLSCTENDYAQRVTLTDRGVLTFSYPPTTDDREIVCKVALQPTPNNALFPDWFVQRWQRGIIARALELLYGMAEKPWTSPAGAAEQRMIFVQEANRAKRELVTERLNGPMRFTMRTL